MLGEEGLNLRQCEERLVEVVEAELKEGRLFNGDGGFFEHFGWGGAGDGNTDLADAGA